MTITVHQFPCLTDNYGFLVRDGASGLVACIDTPDPAVIFTELDRLGWQLTLILNTHWHPDHAGGNAEVRERTGALIVAPIEVEETSPIDRIVTNGDVIELGSTRLEVMETGGHTLGHVTYYSEHAGIAFVGDTLFPMGCGRLFEGTPEQMWSSLSRIADLPRETLVYSAHEYSLANARFALTIDKDPMVAARSEVIAQMRSRGEPTVPTTIALERDTNPFLRAPSLVTDHDNPVDAFAHLRAAKDRFPG